jgi:hypothetical protein
MSRPSPRLRPWTRSRDAVRLLLSGATARDCLPVALVVATVLSVVNQGDVIAKAAAGAVVALKVLANYAWSWTAARSGRAGWTPGAARSCSPDGGSACRSAVPRRHALLDAGGDGTGPTGTSAITAPR